MPLFKAFAPPDASLSVELAKKTFVLGDTVEGTITISSKEDFVCQEVRVELLGLERIRGNLQDFSGNAETRIYGPINSTAASQKPQQTELIMLRTPIRLVGSIRITNGFTQQFPFRMVIPSHLGSTFQGGRNDGSWMQRIWVIKAILAVGGRPDIDFSVEINVASAPSPSQAPSAPPISATMGATGATLGSTIGIPIPPPPKSAEPPPTNCPKCGAPLTITQEDIFLTCKYCGNSIILGTNEQLRKHSMLENHMFTQQVVETALKYMDKGLLRVGVSRDAVITNTKLRHLPFWIFTVSATTSFRGVTNAGLGGEIRQMSDALEDPKASTSSKLGKIILAGAGAYMETQGKHRPPPRTVAQTFSNRYTWPILARQTMVSEIHFYDVPTDKKIPFDPGKLQPDTEFLNSEFGEADAKEQARIEVEEKENKIASCKVDSLQTISTNVVVGEGELIHAPIWFVYYTLKGENFAIVIEGSEGKVLGGGRPLIKLR